MEKTMQKLPEKIKTSLKEVTREQIIDLRITERRFVVIKIGDKLYFTPIKSQEEAEKIRSAFPTHKCGDCGNFFCNGELCQKVADLSVENCSKEFFTKREAVQESKRIEKYPFIVRGVEYFYPHSSQKEYLIVEECLRFKENNDQKERDELWEKMQKEAEEAKCRATYQARRG